MVQNKGEGNCCRLQFVRFLDLSLLYEHTVCTVYPGGGGGIAGASCYSIHRKMREGTCAEKLTAATTFLPLLFCTITSQCLILACSSTVPTAERWVWFNRYKRPVYSRPFKLENPRNYYIRSKKPLHIA